MGRLLQGSLTLDVDQDRLRRVIFLECVLDISEFLAVSQSHALVVEDQILRMLDLLLHSQLLQLFKLVLRLVIVNIEAG